MRVLVELSGGADSAAAALLAKEAYPHASFSSIFIDYGQRMADEEREASSRLHQKIGFPQGSWHEVVVRGLFGDTGLAGGSDIYTPVRNLALTGIAITKAVALKAEVVISGSKGLSKVENDRYSYRDSTIPFYVLMEAVANYAIERDAGIDRVSVVPILAVNRERKMGKSEVYQILRQNGIGPDETFSCFFPVDGKECGECKNCLEKKPESLNRPIGR